MSKWHVVGIAAAVTAGMALLGVIGSRSGLTVPFLGIKISPFDIGGGAGGGAGGSLFPGPMSSAV